MSGWGDPHNLETPRTARLRELDRLIRAEPNPLTPVPKPSLSRRERRFETLRLRMQQSRRPVRDNPFRSRAASGIIQKVSERLDIPLGLILSGGHSIAEVTEARRQISVELRALGWSLPRIGYSLNLHHTSILYLLKKTAKPVQRAYSAYSREVPCPDLSGEWAI